MHWVVSMVEGFRAQSVSFFLCRLVGLLNPKLHVPIVRV